MKLKQGHVLTTEQDLKYFMYKKNFCISFLFKSGFFFCSFFSKYFLNTFKHNPHATDKDRNLIIPSMF